MYRTPENLKPSGEIELFPEYRSAYVSYDLKKLYDSDKMINEKYEIVEVPTKITNIEAAASKTTTAPTADELKREIKAKLESVNLNLRGQQSLVPEYKAQFVEPTAFQKSLPIPQLNNLRAQPSDSIDRSPSEYKENFHSYENFIKSAPIKKQDNLNLKGKFSLMPEYTDRYQEIDLTKFERSAPCKSEDHFKVNYSRNNVSLDSGSMMPEYNESFQDPHITSVPEKMKSRRPHLDLRGAHEYNPEYKCTYVDFPRTRPIIKKPKSNINLYTGYTENKNGRAPTPTAKFGEKVLLPPKVDPQHQNYHHFSNYYSSSDEQIPLQCQPEYRKARREFMLRERDPLRKQPHDVVDYINKNEIVLPENAAEVVAENSDETDVTNNNSIKNRRSPVRVRMKSGSSKTLPRRQDSKTASLDSSVSPQRSSSKTGFRYTVENVDAPKLPLHQRTAKFGRRSSTTSNSDVNKNSAKARHQTRVIEGNTNYIRDTTDYYGSITQPAAGRVYNKSNDNQRAFVVLQEPCKRSAWMKPTWYDP